MRLDLGGVRLTIVNGGRLRLDGGAMFGIIPKALWSRRTTADADNRIELACNCVLLETSGPAAQRALIEVGHGCKYDQKEQQIFAIDPQQWLLPALRAGGVAVEEIEDVILSHLHFDHAGGLTHPGGDPGGPLAPTFPRARVHVQRREFEDARANFGIMTNTYREQNFQAIDDAKAWRLLDGPAEVIPRVQALLTAGHTRGHHSLKIIGEDRTAVFAGDVLPTAAHVGPPYNMAYDLLPLENRVSKRELLGAAADGDWLLILDHEPQTPVVSVRRVKDWFELTPVSAAAS